MIKRRFMILAALQATLLILDSCSGNNSVVTEEEEILPEDIVELRDDQIRLADIELGKIEMRAISNNIKANGVVTVAPGRKASVCMPIGGFVKSTTLLPGDRVTKGQTLALIENQDFVDMQLAYIEARNKLTYAQAEFERHTSLFEKDVYSEKNLQQVTVEYRNLVALVKSLEQKLILIGIDPAQLKEDNISSTVNLQSPLTGFLCSVNIRLGMYVSPTDILFEVINNDSLFLELTLFEKDAAKVAPGQQVRFFINDEDEEHEATVIQTGKSVTGDKSLPVYAEITSECKNILPGMYVSSYIWESNKEVTSVQSDAVVSFDDVDYIFIYNRDKEEGGMTFTEYRMIEVRKGASSSGLTEIILPDDFDIENTRVVVKGAYNLLSAKKNSGEMAC
jgi:cobalt-zinc-cadmium efflux system membrane fusion protein